MHKFNDPGLSNVFLFNGFVVRSSDEGRSVRYEHLDDLVTAIACTLIRKQARLDCGEFRWLRKFTELSQREFAEKIGYDVQSVSLWERTAPSPVLVDRELRRL